MSAPDIAKPAPRVVIQASKGWSPVNFGELIAHRDLIRFLVWRDLKVRYRQTVLGAGWAVIQPLMTMAMMAIVFGKFVGVPSDGAPYPLFCLSGLILWTFFSQAVTNASNSVINNAQLIEKVYFPRLAIPISTALSGLLDFVISLGLLLIVMAFYGYAPGVRALLCVPILLVALLLAIGIGSAFAAFSVRYRDVKHVLPFLVQLWLFATPVIYPFALIPARWQPIAALNPLAGVVEAFRWAMLGAATPPWQNLSVSLIATLLIVPAGLLLFRRMERGFADVI